MMPKELLPIIDLLIFHGAITKLEAMQNATLPQLSQLCAYRLEERHK